MDASNFNKKLKKVEKYLGIQISFIPEYYRSVLDDDVLGTKQIAVVTEKSIKTTIRWFSEGIQVGDERIYLTPISIHPYKTSGYHLKDFLLKWMDWRIISKKIVRDKTLAGWFHDIVELEN